MTGYTGDYDTSVLVAYIPISQPDLLYKYWPEAEKVEKTPAEDILFTSRFPKPDWWNADEDAPEVVEQAGWDLESLTEYRKQAEVLIAELEAELERVSKQFVDMSAYAGHLEIKIHEASQRVGYVLGAINPKDKHDPSFLKHLRSKLDEANSMLIVDSNEKSAQK